MISALNAFVLGYLPATLGTYFNGLELTAALSSRPDRELAARVQSRQHALGAQHSQIASELQKVHELLTATAIAAPPAPTAPLEYHSWCGQVFTAVHEKLQSEPLLGALHLVGFVLGDAWVTLTLSGVVSYFLAASPQDPFLTAQAAALMQEQEKVQRQLAKAVTHPLWNDAQRQAITDVLTALQGATALPEDPVQRLAALAPIMDQLSTAMDEVQRTLFAP